MRKAVKTVQKEFVSVKSLEEMLSTSLNNYEEVRSDLDVMSRRLGQSESGLDRFKSDSYRMFVSAIDFTESNAKIKSELRTCAKQSDINRSLQPYVLQVIFFIRSFKFSGAPKFISEKGQPLKDVFKI